MSTPPAADSSRPYRPSANRRLDYAHAPQVNGYCTCGRLWPHEATGVVVPEPTRCSPDAAENGCTVNAETCTCTYLHGCSEDEGGCCFCVHMDIYHPCPTFGFGCGPGCDCCTPLQQRQVVRNGSVLRGAS